MDIANLSSIGAIQGVTVRDTTAIGADDSLVKNNSNLFETILNTAIDNVKTTNNYLSDAENEEIRFALGETQNTHDLMIALQKASTALQYTVAVRDKLLESYKEIMQMQI
ncbi:MAG: flagellar hook-basal body complex protein FliE [Lachnospiraceae bacterium]|nr:flagellar hook-basal body complex protein FliE [Lachnospiraceae bacterium]